MDNSQRVLYLKSLQMATNDALSFARHANVAGAINWGDLSCVESNYLFNQDGDESYSVLIEEADSRNYELQKYVFEYLEAHGFSNVDVVTDW